MKTPYTVESLSKLDSQELECLIFRAIAVLTKERTSFPSELHEVLEHFGIYCVPKDESVIELVKFIEKADEQELTPTQLYANYAGKAVEMLKKDKR